MIDIFTQKQYLVVTIILLFFTLVSYIIKTCLLQKPVTPLIKLEDVLDEINIYIDSFYTTILTARLFEVTITNKKNDKLEEIINDMTLNIYIDFTKNPIINKKLDTVFLNNKEDFTIKYIKSRLLIITSTKGNN